MQKFIIEITNLIQLHSLFKAIQNEDVSDRFVRTRKTRFHINLPEIEVKAELSLDYHTDGYLAFKGQKDKTLFFYPNTNGFINKNEQTKELLSRMINASFKDSLVFNKPEDYDAENIAFLELCGFDTSDGYDIEDLESHQGIFRHLSEVFTPCLLEHKKMLKAN
jgi:hypothetical protein